MAQNASSGAQTGKRTNTGGTQTEMASSSTQHPVYTVNNDSRVSGTNSSMQGGVSYRPNVPTNPHFVEGWRGPGPPNVPTNPVFQDGWRGPGPSSGAPPATVAAAAVASTLALQEKGITDTVSYMDMDARKRLSERAEQIGARSKRYNNKLVQC